MLSEVLKPGRLMRDALLFAAGGALLVIGCFAELVLSDLAYVPHTGITAVLKMEEHVERGIGCVDCHAGAKKEERAGMPKREFCVDCHEDVDKPEVKKKHAPGGPIFDAEGKPKWTTVTTLPEDVNFSHAKHTEAHGCDECHGDIEHGECGLVDLAAKFDNCRRCHRDEDLFGNCAHCHSTFDKATRPHSHDREWQRTHGLQVRHMGGLDLADRTCGSCHPTSDCLSCHQEERPRDHTIFWTRAGHGLVADIDRERCMACHTEDRCIRCHLDGAPTRPAPHPVSSCTRPGCHVVTPAGHGALMVTDNCMLCHK